MAKQSAGILLYRFINNQLQVFLVHPGGPFYKNKDDGSWSIPKGEFADDENPLDAAKREFLEETGQIIHGNFTALTPIRQKGGKTVHAWAIEGDVDHKTMVSNTFEIEWPPRSGKKQTFPEIDKAAWFDTGLAKIKINAAQSELINELALKINL
ncbi:NUDIX domain-containing protein [Mucilaginibacter sp. BT774]|uniref:NUDIX domain-containing protein n=1 Tax=Mucilaginibacter sp. BT774 TaxID=3062276 RepID=UPI002676F951|nr:NUDIX domain-containing protein [Mucilaginibacter sp. BT774]MDO3626364.1 NUDIX domain-containing protein [Mucilaginibacter sp. BT774]